MFVYMLISEYLDKIEWFVEFILASEDSLSLHLVFRFLLVK